VDEYGNLLFMTKNAGLKKGIVFLALGVLLLVGSYFVYASTLFCLFGSIFIFVGLYFIFFKRKNGVAIFEKAIVFLGKENRVVQKNDIKTIEYKKVRARRSPIASYYPILVLKDNSVIQLDISFNSLVNQQLEIILKEYLSK
jgi:hypothetical protein